MNKMNIFKRACMIGLFALSFGAHAATMSVATQKEINYIKFSGKIVRGDGKKFERIVNQSRAKGAPIDIVLLNSPGGILGESYDIIDVILDNEISTVVGPASKCISACVGIFAAGDERILYPTSKVGVHRARNGREDNDRARGSSIDLMEVYKDLDIPDNIRLKMIETPPDEIYYLTVNEMKEFSSDETTFESKSPKKEIREASSNPVTAAGDFTSQAVQLRDQGIELVKAKKYDEATDVLKRSLTLNTDDPRTNYFLGLTHYNTNDYGNAKNYFLAAISLRNSYAVAWQGLGLIYSSEGKIDDAANCFVSYFKYTGNKAKALETFSRWEEQAIGKPLYKTIKLTKARLGIND